MASRRRIFHAMNFVLSGLLLLGQAIAGPDLSGTWIRNKTKSDRFTAINGSARHLPKDTDVILSIHYGINLLQIQTKDGGWTSKITYLTDGKTHGGKRRFGGNVVGGGAIYKSGWKGNTLEIEKSAVFAGEYGHLQIMFR